MAYSNLTPVAANFSILGVCIPKLEYNLSAVALNSSVITNNIFG